MLFALLGALVAVTISIIVFSAATESAPDIPQQPPNDERNRGQETPRLPRRKKRGNGVQQMLSIPGCSHNHDSKKVEEDELENNEKHEKTHSDYKAEQPLESIKKESKNNLAPKRR